MDVPKYKLNASVRGVLAQRLLRKVCTGCAIKRPISVKDAVNFQIKQNTPIMFANSLSAEEKLSRKRENTLCPQCQGSGYKGRVGVYELLLLDRKIQNAKWAKENPEKRKVIAKRYRDKNKEKCNYF